MFLTTPPKLFDLDHRLRALTAGNATPPIVVAAFGSSNPRALEVYRSIDDYFGRQFQDQALLWAFTAQTVINKLRNRGADALSVEEVLAHLAAAGSSSAAIQPLQVAPGQEFRRLQQLKHAALRLVVGRPILDRDESLTRVLDAVAHDLKSAATNVLVLHGNRRFRQYNAHGIALAGLASRRWQNVFVASLEGSPGTAPLSEARRHAQRTGHAHFVPLLLAEGNHMAHDVMGNRNDSWKQIVAARQTTCAPPLGHNRKILELLVERIRQTLAETG